MTLRVVLFWVAVAAAAIATFIGFHQADWHLDAWAGWISAAVALGLLSRAP